MNINLAVADVVVSADDQLGAGLLQFIEIAKEKIEILHLHRLSFITRSSAWEVGAHDAKVANIDTQISALVVIGRVAGSFYYVIGFYFGKNSHAAISILHCGKNVAMKSQRFKLPG